MKISACYIVKNEEKNIARSIASLQGEYDELIVIDTGSVDSTVNVAKEHGAVCYNYAWNNDFSKARNYAISKANGDWIIFLDADEYYTKNTSIRKYLMELVRTNDKVDALYISLHDAYKIELPSIKVIRVFKNSGEIFYRDAIHETLTKKNGELNIIDASELEFMHLGYHHEIMPQKLTRNLAMLLEDIEKNGEKEHYYYYIAECYFGLRDYEKAIFYIKKAFSTQITHIGEEGNYYHILLESMRQCDYPINDMEMVCDEAIELFPEMPEFYGEKGIIISSVGRLDEALRFLYKSFCLYYSNDRKKLSFGYMDDHAIQVVCERIAKICIILNRPVLAEISWRITALLGGDSSIDNDLKGKYLSEIDEQGKVAYANINNKDGYYWLKLLAHVYSLNKALYILTNDDIILSEDEKEICSELADCPLNDLRMPLEKAIIADSWLLVYMAAELESGILPHEQDFLQDEERKMWNVYSELLKEKNTIMIDEKYPLISVMIPTYNQPEIFSRTIRSAVIQDYPKLEIIVCDNSTNEETANCIKKYAYDKRIIYVRNNLAKNKSENFRSFEKLAKGDYLQWLMHDDILAPHKITLMANALYNNPNVTLVTSQRGVIDEYGNKCFKEMQSDFGIELETKVFPGDLIGNVILKSSVNYIGEPSAVLFRRNDLNNHYWGAESRGYYALSDVAMWLELLEKGDLFVFKEELSYYRRHSQQEGQNIDVVFLSRIEWYNLITFYFRTKKFIYDKNEYIASINNLVNEYGKLNEVCDRCSNEIKIHYTEMIEKCVAFIENK